MLEQIRSVMRPRARLQELRFRRLYAKYRPFTMIRPDDFAANLRVAHSVLQATPGAVVECGTWRGGMSAALIEIGGPDRDYHFFDSFQGLPPARESVDGRAAIDWQSNPFTAFFQSAAGDAWRDAMLRGGERFWEAQRKWLDDYETLSRTLLGRRRAATEATLDTMRKLCACRDNSEWAQCCAEWASGSVTRIAADGRDMLEEGLKMMSNVAASLSAELSETEKKTAAERETALARGAAIAQTAAAMQDAAARAGKVAPRFKKADEDELSSAGLAG